MVFLTHGVYEETNLAPEITFENGKLGPWANLTAYVYMCVCIYIYAVKLLAGPSLAFLSDIVWSK